MMATPHRTSYSLLACLVALGSFASRLVAQEAATDRAIENLVQFGRLYGYVRYFHPSEEAVALDWDRFLILGVETARAATNDKDLRGALTGLFSGIVADLKITDAIDGAAAPHTPPESSDEMIVWQHYGVQLSSQSNVYRSRRVIAGKTQGIRVPLFETKEKPPQTFSKLIGPDIAVQFPLALLASAEGRAYAGKHAEFVSLQQRLARQEVNPLMPTWQSRVAGVVATWNVFQHFHPYIDHIGLNWEEVLRPALRRAFSDRTRDDYYLTLSEMVAHLQDGHGYVYGNVVRGGLPIRVVVIDEQIVVTAAEPDAPFRKGDVILRVDEVDAMQVLRDRERYVSGSPHLRRHRALNQYGEGPEGSIAKIDILRDGAPEKLETKRLRDRRSFFFNAIGEFQFPAIEQIKPGIFYVNLPSIQLSALRDRVPDLASATGIIFDERWDGRRAGTMPADRIQTHVHIIPHLIDKAIQASPMRTPQITQPDRVGWTWSEATWPVEPRAPRFKGSIVFITEPSVVSYGETCMAMIADYGLAKLVGAPTAGCNGNANYILLPGGFRIMWTGMEVLKHDHSPFYGKGFVPDYPVSRTLQGVKDGRDEYLEKAIAVVEQDTPSEP